MSRIHPFILIFWLTFNWVTSQVFAQSEPSNHVTGFTVTATSSSVIGLTWTDASGPVLPDYYLIVGRVVPTGTFVSVGDGPEIPADPDWTDGNFAAIVSHGSGGTLTVTGLDPETQYEFAIYPYRESSGNANYKTSPAPPSSSDFTFSLQPGGHSTTFTAVVSGSTDIILSFDAASTLTNADGYVIYRREGSPASLTGLNNGTAPPLSLAGTTIRVTITNNTATSYTDTGLDGGKTYHYVLVPYNYDGTHNETFNYLTNGSEPRANATTTLVITLAQLTGGVAPSPLSSGSTNQAILGFSITTNGPVTFNGLNVNLTSTPSGKFISPRIFSSANNIFDFSDVSVNSGTLTPSQLQFSSIGQTLTAAGTYYYFVVVNINASVNASTPAIQPSFSETNLTFTSPPVTAQPATITGINYSFVDVTPPSITSTNPPDNATNVPVSLNTLQITFDENVIYDGDNSTANEQIRIRNVTSGTFVETIDPLNVSVSGNIVTFTFSTSLSPGTNYAIYIGNSVFKDAENNHFVGINNDNDWNFQTEFPPSITGYSADPTCMGESIIIFGTGFGSTTPSVTINGVAVSPSASSPTSITVTIPTTSTGDATVVVTNTTNGLSASDNTLTLKNAIAASLPVYSTPAVPVVDQNYQISVDNTQAGVNYRLRELPNPFTGSGTPGTGSTITFSTIFNKSAPGLYQYEVQAQSTGCTSQVYGPLSVNIIELRANAGNDTTVCAGSNVRLGGSPTAEGGTGFYSITWSASPPDPSLAGQTNSSNPLVSPTVTTTYTVVVDDSSPATPATDQIIVTVNQPADPDNIEIVLTPDSAAYNVKSGPVNLSYNLTGGVTGTGVFSGNGVNSSNNKFYPGAANIGPNTITLTFTNSDGCITTKTRVVNVFSPDAYLPGLNEKYCVNYGNESLSIQELPSETFQDIVFLYKHSTGEFLHHNAGMGWDFNATTNQIMFNTSVLGESQYTFYLYYYRNQTCLRTIYIFNTLCSCFVPILQAYDCSYYYYATVSFEIVPLPVLLLETETAVCINSSNPLIRINPSGGNLSVNGGTNGLVFSGGEYFLDIDHPDLYTTGEPPGVNTLHYTYTDQNNCTNTTNLNVTIFDVPIPYFDNASVCDGDTKAFSLFPGTIIPPGVTVDRYIWNLGDGFTYSSFDVNEVFSYAYRNPDNYNVQLTMLTTDNCSNAINRIVTVAPVPVVSFTWENVCHDQATQFFGNVSLPDGQINSFEWNFGDGVIITKNPPRNDVVNESNTTGTVIDPLHSFTLSDSTQAQLFNVSLRVTSNFNCSSDSVIQIYKVPNIKVTGLGSFANHISDFDGSVVQWVSGGINNSWQLGIPAGTLINQDASGGGKAWVTNLTGPYNANEKSWVHSPCFDLRTLNLPVLSFDRRLLTGSEDGVVLQLNTTNTTQGNLNWQVVGSVGEGINWYNSVAILGQPGGQVAVGWEGSPSADSTGWRKSLIALDDYLPPLGSAARKNVRFRFAFGSDGGFTEREGFAFDNFEINKRGKVILVEQFTNNGSSNSGPSEANKVSNAQVNNFIGLPKTTNEIVKVQYHVGFPGPNIDRLYQDNTIDASARAAYYGITNTPYTLMNAIRQAGDFYNPPDPPGTSWAPNLFSQLSLAAPKIRIDTIFTSNENTDSIEDSLTITTRFTALENIPPGMAIHIVVVEREIDAVTGTNGETNFTYVMKKMLPSALGYRYGSAISTGFTDLIKVHWVPRAYNLDSLSVVVFAQQEISKEVYQTRFLRNLQYIPTASVVTNTENPFTLNNIHVYPNPASSILQIEFTEALQQTVPITLTDMHGRPVIQTDIQAGKRSKTLNTTHLAAGMYLLQLQAGPHAVRKKIIIAQGH